MGASTKSREEKFSVNCGVEYFAKPLESRHGPSPIAESSEGMKWVEPQVLSSFVRGIDSPRGGVVFVDIEK